MSSVTKWKPSTVLSWEIVYCDSQDDMNDFQTDITSDIYYPTDSWFYYNSIFPRTLRVLL
jgi:hypothetical protein